ncbi:ribonucleotide reductase small subunit [Boletus coccyginus]|nr:ribonucleotide reductase small subunit [Boletus coccyginus]
MAAILAPLQISSLLPTPSEKLQLPSKPSSLKEPLLDDKKCSISPDSLVDDPSLEEDEFEVLHAKFIGEVDLSECEELLLKVFRRQFVLFPIQYHEEMDLSKDLHHRNTHLNNNEQQFNSHILAFFAASDGIVQAAEAHCFYGFQIMMENIHSETYSLLIDSYIKDSVQCKYLFDVMDTIPCIKCKADWALKWISDQHSTFATHLVAFTTVEGIPFLGIHTNFACLLFSHLKWRPHPDVVWWIITGAVKIEQGFLTDALPVTLIRMNAKLMHQHIEFVADCLLISLGNEKVYNRDGHYQGLVK